MLSVAAAPVVLIAPGRPRGGYRRSPLVFIATQEAAKFYIYHPVRRI